MARGDFGSGEYLRRTPPGSFDGSEPFTMAMWAYVDDITSYHPCMSLTVSGNNNKSHTVDLSGDLGGDPCRAFTSVNVFGNGIASSSSGYSANTWHHVCGKFIASNDRAVLLDGGNKGTNTGNISVGNCDELSIATTRWAGTTYTNDTGRFAEFGLWDVALTDEEIAMLANGFSPLLVRPESLISYLPGLSGSGNERDFIDGGLWTLTGTVGQVDHPPIYKPGSSKTTIPGSTAINKSVALVSETDLAQVINKLKQKSINQTTETDISQAISNPKVITAETDTSQAIVINPIHKLVNTVTETDLAQALVSTKFKLLTQVNETDISQAISNPKVITVVQTGTTSLAQVINRLKQKALVISTETNYGN